MSTRLFVRKEASGIRTLVTPALYAFSWLLLGYFVFLGLGLVPNEIVGGMYSNVDGAWAEWNAHGILRFGQILDLSPFNAFAGMGGMYLPNLPWVNPGALALGLPLGRAESFTLSYLIYMIELAGSIVILGRALGFSWATATIAAQLHIVALFPPFSHLFLPIEWYSAAPVYAHIASILNIAFALFTRCGRDSRPNRSLVIAFLTLVLVVAGLFSAPFSFLFFCAPYATLAITVLAFTRPSSVELKWKFGLAATLLLLLAASGFVDYLVATARTSARTPAAPVLWESLLSPRAWIDMLASRSICSDPRTLMCNGNHVWWLSFLGLLGGALFAIHGRGISRALGVWAVLYIAFVHLYAFPYQQGWLGPVGTLSVHFLSWSSYSFMCLLAVAIVPQAVSIGGAALRSLKGMPFGTIAAVAGAIILAILAFRSLLKGLVPSNLTPTLPPLRWWWVTSVLLFAAAPVTAACAVLARRLHPDPAAGAENMRETRHPMAIQLAVASIFVVALFVVPVTTFRLLPKLAAAAEPLRDPGRGPIVELLIRETSLDIGKPFRGYVATYWSEAVNRVDATGTAAVNPTFRYIHAREYFRSRYGNNFSETDLWHYGIPTFEEYGQWVSRQAQLFTQFLLVDERARAVPKQLTFLRVYKVDVELMRALGIRFLITDSMFPGNRHLTLRATETRPGAISVNLFELEATNLGTYSPTHQLEAGRQGDVLSRIAAERPDLESTVFVAKRVPGPPFLPARSARMILERDGYRVAAESEGRSALLLPIQFSNCLAIEEGRGNGAFLVRANFLQTLLVFSRSIDATIKLDFGLFGRTACRHSDADDLAGLSL